LFALVINRYCILDPSALQVNLIKMSTKHESSPLLPQTLPQANSTSGDGEVALYNGFPYSMKTITYISFSLVYCYMICGVVTVAIGATLEDLAADVGYSSTDIGTVYVARGIGSILGSFVCFYIFEAQSPIRTLATAEAVTCLTIFALPFITSLYTLHVAYFIIGALNSVMQTGAMHVLRNLHGDRAGPWLGGLGACFVSAGVIVPGVQLLTASLLWQCVVFGGLIVIGVLWFLTLPDVFSEMKRLHELNLEKNSEHTEGIESDRIPHYWAELMVASMIFLIIGGGDAVTFYIETYVDETGIIKPSLKALLLLVFYMFAAIGNVFGIVGQIGISDRKLSIHLFSFVCTGGLGMLAVACFPSNSTLLWIGVGLYGLTTGPAVSYSFNIANRLSIHSAMSSAVIILGMSLGISFLPYATSCLWKYYDSPIVLIVVASASISMAVPFLFLAPSVSYLKKDRTFISFW
jgi:predicted MFS family arabinose efflux permease